MTVICVDSRFCESFILLSIDGVLHVTPAARVLDIGTCLFLYSAYHGHTTTIIDIGPYKFNGQGGEGKKPWVHVVCTLLFCIISVKIQSDWLCLLRSEQKFQCAVTAQESALATGHGELRQ